jgi:hypothetical protein
MGERGNIGVKDEISHCVRNDKGGAWVLWFDRFEIISTLVLSLAWYSE